MNSDISMGKIPIIAIVGATATGKTKASIELAQELNGEIISSDSMQLYKGMDIATAKPTIEERCGIKHHLLDILELNQCFSVAEYVKLANDSIIDIHSRSKMPILVGGTGLYVTSLLDNVKFSEQPYDVSLKQELEEFAEVNGNIALYDRLCKVDIDYAVTLHPNNKIRIIRAIELFLLTGKKMSEHIKESKLIESPYNATMIGLNFSDRNILYDRINMRVDIMLKNGLLKEAENILSQELSTTASQAIGYKELKGYFDGVMNLNDCISKLKQDSRHYAKRQLTWFNRDKRINWKYLDVDNNSIIKFYKKTVEKSV